jgi:hypothetical protein
MTLGGIILDKKRYILREIVAIIKGKQLDFDIFAQPN